MRKSLPWMLLVVSICFNVFFVFGYVQSRAALASLQTPEGRAEYLASELGLTGPERERFLAITVEWRKKVVELQQAHQADLDAFWAEILKEPPDENRLQTLFQRNLKIRDEGAAAWLEHVRRGLQSIPPGKRAQLVQLIRRIGFAR